MSFPYASPYGSYQSPYPAYPAAPSAQYGQLPTASYPLYQPVQPKSSPSPPDLPHPPLDLTSVTPQIAKQATQHMIAAELRDAGFDSAQPLALQRLELELVAFVEELYRRAHEYANLANRAGPITTDLKLACEEVGLQTKELRRTMVKSNKNKNKRIVDSFTLLPPPSRSPSPELLASDDEGAPPAVPATLRTLPHYLPNLPPKHTYLRTPASPPKKAALPSLDKKLKNAALVQESLKNLLVATDDSSGQEDGELLGHIVNWEASTHARKRWKSGA